MAHWPATLRSVCVYAGLAGGLAYSLGSGPAAAGAAAAAILLAVCLSWPQLNRIPRTILCVVAVTLTIALWHAPGALLPGLVMAARLAALVVAVLLLSFVLGQSRRLTTLSEHLFLGRPAARYSSLTFGTLTLAMPLNFGAVSLMATLIGRELSARGNTPAARNAARAVLRGFGSASLCSPLSIAVVLTLTLVPGVSGTILIPITLPIATLYLLSGLYYREPEARPVPGSGARLSRDVIGAWGFFFGCIALICVGVLGLHLWFGLAYAAAVTWSCLAVVVMGWPGLPAGKRRPPALGGVGNELAIICGSAFLGTTLSAWVVAGLAGDITLPVWAIPLVPLVLPGLLFAGGCIGINPLIAITLIGGLAGALWPPAAGPGLAVAMVSGWGITIAGTPYSANALLMQRLTGYDNRQITLGWSLSLSLWALAAASLAASALALLGLAGQA